MIFRLPFFVPDIIYKFQMFCLVGEGGGAMVFNTTFSNISVISWRSVVLVEEIGVPGENHRLAQVTDKLYHVTLHRVLLT